MRQFIMSCHHKDDESINIFKKYFTPINVGANTNHIKNEILKDNSLNNISDKNPYFCELTALYWAWKNNKNDYVGLMHYRRVFLKPQNIFLKTFKKIINNLRINLNRFSIKHYYLKNIDDSKLEKNLKDLNSYLEKDIESYDIFMPKPLYLDGLTIEEQFNEVFPKNTFLSAMIEITLEFYPEMKDSLKKTMQRKDMSAFNMMIIKREFFEEYMEALFRVMFKVEEKFIFDKNDLYKQRMIGFLAERFLNIYMDYFISENSGIKKKYLEVALIK